MIFIAISVLALVVIIVAAGIVAVFRASEVMDDALAELDTGDDE